MTPLPDGNPRAAGYWPFITPSGPGHAREDVPGGDTLDPTRYLFERYATEDAGARSSLLTAYYAMRPFMPRGLQLALRRRYARRQARREFPRWPIEPILVEGQYAAMRAQLHAAGGERLEFVDFWPDGMQFCAVLTHDVEGPAGIRNIPRLLELEAKHGFRSSWNFVAEDYDIPARTFDEIRSAGGEVGLHGINHDGKLFLTRERFETDLPKIHRYLAEWDAAGFRSPATHRNADWMPELGAAYDTSFPDSDPFEPQSGGCCSIFPFFLGDVVELPITLTQDHTVFEILREESIDRWRAKSEWIIRHRGLVNVIVHPDYLLDRRRLEVYEEFLVFLGRQERCWRALPREVADWWRLRAALDQESVPDAASSTPPRATIKTISGDDLERGLSYDGTADTATSRAGSIRP